MSDLRNAARFFRRRPAIVSVAASCVAVGIGANATITAIADTLLFRAPPHVRDAEAVASIGRVFVATGGGRVPSMDDDAMSLTEVDVLRGEMRSAIGVAAYAIRDLTLGRGAEARPASVVFATSSYFPVLGTAPAAGRFFSEHDDQPGTAVQVAVLSYGLWERQFGGSRTAIGRTIAVGRGSYTVVGVAPRGFRGVALDGIDVWVPAEAALTELFNGNVREFRERPWMQVVARVRGAAAFDAARTEGSAALQHFYLDKFGPRFGLLVAALAEPIIPGRGREWTTSARIAVWLWLTSIIVLVIAGVNVVSLFSARGFEQRRETAVRLALGCNRARLVRQRLAESLAVAITGALGGVLLSRWSEGMARALIPELRDAGPLVDGRVLLVSLVLAIVCGLVTGVVPALIAGRTDVSAALKADQGTGSSGRAVYANGLIALQIAGSVALLIAAGAFTRSLRNLRQLDVGYQSDRLVVASMDPSSVGYARTETEALFDRMRERVRTTPGVSAVAVAWSAPTAAGARVPGVEVSGGTETGASSTPPLFQVNGVTEEYLLATGIPLRGGRWLTAADRADTRPVVVINELMARAYFPAGDAIGHCLTVTSFTRQATPDSCREIVGVVGTTRAEVRGRDQFQIYVPLAQRIAPDLAGRVLIVRAARDPRQLIAAIRRVMQSTAPDVPFADVRRAAEIVDPQLRPWRLGSTVFTILGGVTLLLMGGGLYGTFSYAVTRRRRELGIRIALGAPHRSVVGQLLGESLRVASIGTILGVGLALAASGALRSLLFGVAPMDALVVSVAVAAVLCAAVGATLPAAVRATRVDPRVAFSAD